MEPTTNLFDLQIDQPASNYLRETAKWAKFLSIVGFIMCGLIVIVGVFFGSMISTLMGMGNSLGDNVQAAGAMSMILPIIYVCVALFYFFPCLYLFKFSVKAKSALAANDQQAVSDAFKNLKSCFKFIGICTIIVLSFYALALVVAVGGSIMRR